MKRSVDHVLDQLYHDLLDMQLEYGDLVRGKVVSWKDLKALAEEMEELQEEIRRIEDWDENNKEPIRD